MRTVTALGSSLCRCRCLVARVHTARCRQLSLARAPLLLGSMNGGAGLADDMPFNLRVDGYALNHL